MSALLQGGLFLCLLGLLSLSPSAPPLELPDPGVLIELAPAVAPPGPADPGPRKSSAGPKRRAAASSSPPPAAAPTKEAEPSPPPSSEPAADAAPAALADEGGSEGGGEGSEGGDGGEGGEGGGGGGELPEYRPIQIQQARMTRKVAPRVPEGFYQLDLQEAGCTVRLFLDERGRVAEARPETCPALLREAALSAAYATRFSPLRDASGVAYRAQFVIHYRFVRP